MVTCNFLLALYHVCSFTMRSYFSFLGLSCYGETDTEVLHETHVLMLSVDTGDIVHKY